MILVDDRVGSAEIAPYLSNQKILCRLDYADFAFNGNGPDGSVSIGAERKSLLDMLQSMTSGRLAGHQLIGLKDQYDFVYILIEGVWRPDNTSGVLMRTNGKGRWIAAAQGSRRFMARDLYAFCHTLTVLCGVHVVRTSNQQETGKWLDATYGWWNRPWKSHKSHEQWVKPTPTAQLRKPNLATRVAAQFDGIGWDKARKIGEKFSATDIMSVHPSRFEEVDGIGPKLAQSIADQRKEDER